MQSNTLIKDLFNVSVGLGLFKDIDNLEEARNSLYTCIRKLKDSCLLLDGYSPKHFTMHDIVQDRPIFLASRQHHLFIKRYERLEEWPEGDQLTSCKTIILDRSDIAELPQGLYCPNLTFFHLNNQKPFPYNADNFFSGIRMLKVLNLAAEKLDSLPSSIRLLFNLRALCLNFYKLGNLGIIGELKGLQVLTLISDMTQLPPKLCQLNQLQLLDLRGCYNLVLIPPNLLSSLTKLQELYLATHIYSRPIQWYVGGPNYKQQSMKHRGKEVFDGASDPNNQQSKASLGELNNLARLTTLETRIFDEKMLPKDLVFERLRSYKIIIGLEPNLSSDVEDLHLHHLKGAENVVPGMNEEGMPQLKHLHLQYSDEIQTIVDLSRRNLVVDIFPNMESLFIDCCTNLEEICNGSLPGRSFSRLKVIKVANCGKMKSLFSVSSFRGRPHNNIMEETNESAESMLRFTELQGLMLIGLPELISFRLEDKRDCSAQGKQLPSTDMDGEMVTEDNIPHTPIALFNDKVMLPNLEEMIISYVVKLTTIWHWQQQLCPKSFDKLRKLEIENCPKLMIVFPSHIGSSINSLETLFITNCDSLEHVFEETHSEISGVPASVLCFPNLQQVHVQRCERLKYLFPASVANTLGKLQSLKIENCSKMEEIVIKEDNTSTSSEVVMLPNLEEIIIVNLVKLKMLFNCQQNLKSDSFGRLKNFEIKNCPELLSLLPYHIMSRARSLETLTVVDCKSLELIFSYHGANGRETHGRIADLPGVVNDKHLRGMLNFPNLLAMHVEGCASLKYLFPEFVAKSPVKLKKLLVEKSSLMEEVIMVEENTNPLSKEVRETWESPDLEGSFCNLTTLRIANCERFLKVLPFNVIKSLINLKELEIQNCYSAEAVFDLEGINFEETSVMLETRLKKLTLDSLPNLNQVWRNDPQGLVSFKNLQVVSAGGCYRLKSLFPANIAKGLTQLEELVIDGCGVEEIVANDEGQTMSLCFEFPKLTFLKISNVPKLKCFYSVEYTAEWPMLKELFVYIDSEVNVFGTELLKKHKDHHLEILTEKPIFLVEKVFPNLERLSINNIVSIMDSPHQFPTVHFQRLKELSLHYFSAKQDSIPCWILQRIPMLEELGLLHSSFKQVFPYEGYVEGADSLVLLKRLSLTGLPKLEHICEEGHKLNKYLMKLRNLEV
ncbi:hypothetical protein L6164_026413 [Bauhinia variegata]|uniref:Uncharacterized protein n=1 Tax=Bauhinia variegata TaxID=167791 RepID=A0ACB9LRJ8_BAUVA|nr:hypothetical protein L6164_026413 [Bauhinia variegata]